MTQHRKPTRPLVAALVAALMVVSLVTPSAAAPRPTHRQTSAVTVVGMLPPGPDIPANDNGPSTPTPGFLSAWMNTTADAIAALVDDALAPRAFTTRAAYLGNIGTAPVQANGFDHAVRDYLATHQYRVTLSGPMMNEGGTGTYAKVTAHIDDTEATVAIWTTPLLLPAAETEGTWQSFSTVWQPGADQNGVLGFSVAAKGSATPKVGLNNFAGRSWAFTVEDLGIAA